MQGVKIFHNQSKKTWVLFFGVRIFVERGERNDQLYIFESVLCIAGVGALFVRRRPRVRLETQMSGGGQERGMRSGTLPVPLCVGMGEAARIAEREMYMDKKHIDHLSHRLIQGIREKVIMCTI